jgi:hypothetical protein
LVGKLTSEVDDSGIVEDAIALLDTRLWAEEIVGDLAQVLWAFWRGGLFHMLQV